jgi:hypothetical protein
MTKRLMLVSLLFVIGRRVRCAGSSGQRHFPRVVQVNDELKSIACTEAPEPGSAGTL